MAESDSGHTIGMTGSGTMEPADSVSGHLSAMTGGGARKPGHGLARQTSHNHLNSITGMGDLNKTGDHDNYTSSSFDDQIDNAEEDRVRDPLVAGNNKLIKQEGQLQCRCTN